MSKNIFSEKSNEKLHIKRNVYDKSFQNNLTMRYGKLYPCYVKETMPNESGSIKPTIGLNFMPMVFPVQTKMYVNMHFYYVRYRALWKDWQDFVTGVKDGLVPPFIAKNGPDASEFFKTGSLADYMNIPTQIDSFTRYTRFYDFYLSGQINSDGVSNSYWDISNNGGLSSFSPFGRVVPEMVNSEPYRVFNDFLVYCTGLDSNNTLLDYWQNYANFIGTPYGPCRVFPSEGLFDVDTSSPVSILNGHGSLGYMLAHFYSSTRYMTANAISGFDDAGTLYILGNRADTLNVPSDTSSPVPVVSFLLNNSDNDLSSANLPSSVYLVKFDRRTGLQTGVVELPFDLTGTPSNEPAFLQSFANKVYFNVNVDSSTIDAYSSFVGSSSEYDILAFAIRTHNFTDLVGYPLANGFTVAGGKWWTGFYLIVDGVYPAQSSVLPYAMGTAADGVNPACKISAFPFRAYESIYNSYYRRQQVDEFLINGQPEPNKWITTDAGGADTTDYHFFVRDWEPDCFTTAFPSPQQGDAPLVGANGIGTLYVTDSNGVTHQINSIIGDDGETITGIASFDPETPQGAISRLQQHITAGISINDFRLTNSLQRFLERNLRAGYRYRDLMRAHHGVNIKYNPLDMPEFIGGMSQIVDVSKVVNQSALDGSSPLGAFAGLASAFKKSKHNITYFSDEHGLIMGLVSISPLPVYTQSLDKFWTKEHFLEYYNPEFARIGMQPIPYKEVTPILRFNESLIDSSKDINDTFGYQRAFYEYLYSNDEAHGLFRTDLRNYVMYRLFGESPVLGPDFIHLKEESLNNVFATTDQTDKIMGQIFFQTRVKLPILKHIIPGLE